MDAMPTKIFLLGGFKVERDYRPVVVPRSSERLVAFLALHPPGTRANVAGQLWPDVSERRASASLRSALWRVGQACPDMVRVERERIGLSDLVELDVVEFVNVAKLVVQERCWLADWTEMAEMLRNDLLPGWYEEWVLSERDRLHQLGLHGLEAMSARLLGSGDYAAALEAALRAVAADPLRESAHRAVIAVHLAEGNLREARAQYDACRAVLYAELGIGPSPVCKELFLRAGVPLVAAMPARTAEAPNLIRGSEEAFGARRSLQPRRC